MSWSPSNNSCWCADCFSVENVKYTKTYSYNFLHTNMGQKRRNGLDERLGHLSVFANNHLPSWILMGRIPLGHIHAQSMVIYRSLCHAFIV
ncbi:hypothetical protein EMIT0194P_260038 [Pseudomonas serbica]